VRTTGVRRAGLAPGVPLCPGGPGQALHPDPPRVIGWSGWTALGTQEQYREELAERAGDKVRKPHVLNEVVVERFEVLEE
jgi:hypothetical protein